MASFTETFTQSNGAMSNPPWVPIDTQLQVVSNHLEAPTNAANYQAVWSTPCDSQAQYSEIVQTLGNNGVGYSDVEVTCRSANNAETFYAFLWASSGGTCTYELWKAVAGTWTQLDSAAAATSGTKTIRIEANGSTIRGLVDGVEVCSATDSALTGSYVGINIFRDNGVTSQGDNWAGGDLAATAPAQVTGLTIASRPAAAALAWSAPANGGSAITDYLIERASDSGGSPGSWSTVSDGTSTATSYTDTGLTNGSTYWYRVSAINAVGTGTASTAVSVTPTAHPWPVSYATEGSTSLGSTNAQPLPAGAASGDLVVYFASNDNPSTTNLSASTGWASATQQTQGSNVLKGQVFARILDGTSGNNILSVTGAAQDYAIVGVAIRDHGVTNAATWIAAFVAGAVSSSNGNADPPNLNPGSSDDYLWLAAASIDATTGNTISADPTNFDPGAQVTSASSTSSTVTRVASRRNTASSQNPGTFTNTSRPWIAWTVGVPPVPVSAVEVNPVGASVAGAAGTVNVGGQADVTLSGAFVAAAAGTVAVAATCDIGPQGATVAAVAGTVDVGSSIEINPTGAAVVAVAGQVDVEGQADVTPAGATVLTASGTVSLSAQADVSPVGASVVVAAGTVDVGSATVVDPVGSSVAAISGTVPVAAQADITPQGVAVPAAAGTVDISGQGDVDPQGATVAVVAGTVNIGGAGSVDPVGAVIHPVSGTVTITAQADITLTGTAVPSTAGTVNVTATTTVTPTGATVAAVAGTVDVTGTLTVYPVGAVVVTISGTVSVSAQADIDPQGVAVVAVAGTVDVVIGETRPVFTGAALTTRRVDPPRTTSTPDVDRTTSRIDPRRTTEAAL